MVTREEFIDKANEIHTSSINDALKHPIGIDTRKMQPIPFEQAVVLSLNILHENQRRLAFMLEYIAQRLD